MHYNEKTDCFLSFHKNVFSCFQQLKRECKNGHFWKYLKILYNAKFFIAK